MYIPIILGTAREGRESEKVAFFVFKKTKEKNIDTEIIDVRDFLFAFTKNNKEEEKIKRLEKKIIKSDAIIIVSPEYNNSFPGELKIMLDMFYKEYEKKVVGFCGVSSGNFGGIRAVSHLREVSHKLKMFPIIENLYFRNIKEVFNEKGELIDTSYIERVKFFLDEITDYSKIIQKN